ncbi:SpoIIE family protein phosphatase [Streptomyces sp. NPDC058745]|uniref:SpoIIE family protein phosphatase n=1 Tax=Streptomyces sp. NPDC058745 TaxID=3346621 RepID=UPI00369202DD
MDPHAARHRDSPGHGAFAEAPPELVHAAAIFLDAEGRIAGWSTNAEKLLGYRPTEVVGRRFASLIVDADPQLAADWAGSILARHTEGHVLRLTVRVWTARQTDREAPAAVVIAYDPSTFPWWDATSALLQSSATHFPVGIAVLDTELRFVWCNPELVRLGGVTLEERIGRSLAEVQPMMNHAQAEAAMRRVLETGEPVADFEFFGRSAGAPRQVHAASATIFRLQDASGAVQGVAYVLIDTTERWHTRQRLTLFSEASERIGTTLDVWKTAQELADFAVPRLADVVFVDLLDEVVVGREPPERLVGPPVLRRAAHQSIRAGAPEVLIKIGEDPLYASDHPAHRVLRDGRPLMENIHDSGSGAWLRSDPAREETVARFGLHSHMTVLVRARRTTLGVVTFVRWQRTDPFVEDDLALAQAVIDRAALSLDNARRYTREHKTALALQRSLLPRSSPVSEVLDVASRYIPADRHSGVGGDWFDCIPLSGARYALVVGDVVGHGVHAAAAMGRLRSAVHAFADMDLPPDELLAHLDDLVLRFIDEDEADEPSGLLGSTCLVAVLDPIAKQCVIARAGHPAPLVVSPDGAVEHVDVPAGPPLGLGTLPFEAGSFALSPGSLFVIYTDGLISDRSDDMDVALAELRGLVSGRDSDPEALCDAIVAGFDSTPARDDAALLIARTHAISEQQVAEYDIVPDAQAVAGIRKAVQEQLVTWDLEDLQFSTELIVSELVTNAIRYGRPPLRLRLVRHTVLTCEVADGSGTSPRLRHARTTDEGGRGLFLVAQLSKRWGTRYLATGKIIWSEQVIPKAP